MTRKVFGALILLIVWSNPAMSQTQTDEAAVREVITRLFDGMAKGDSAMVHSAFADDVTMATVFRDKTNNPVFRKEDSIHEFLVNVGTPHPEPWYEEIWNLSVRLDGDLAQVWCDYGLFVGNKFSHCGVDAFHLHKGKDGWKIFHLADTRRRENCQVPDDIKKKHMN
jgi:hypothetical protein